MMPEKTLERFHSAQKNDYAQALKEIKSGHKRSHWIWSCAMRGMLWDGRMIGNYNMENKERECEKYEVYLTRMD